MITGVHDQEWTISSAFATVTANDGGPLILEAIEGLEEGEIRVGIEDTPDADGGAASYAFENPLVITPRGKIAGSSATERNLMIVDLIHALQGLRADCTISSASGVTLAGRLQQRLVITGDGFLKDWTVALVVAPVV